MGVERLLADPAFPKGVPLARLVDPGMVAAMSETVLAHVLDWHRHHYYYRAQQEARRWNRLKQYLASDRTIGLLGLGELGSDAARKLGALGFNVVGWSRRPKTLAGVTCLTQLDAVLREKRRGGVPAAAHRADRGILNSTHFPKIRLGGAVINVARGGHLVAEDLIAALDSGQLAHAYLDVFEPSLCRTTTRSGRTPASPSRRTPPPSPSRAPRSRASSRTSSACAAASRRTTWWTSTPGTESR